MRGHRPRFALRQRASAGLAIATLLGLLVLQPFHGVAEPSDTAASAASTQLSAAGSPTAPHDAETCQLCRAVAQVRSGLRPALPPCVAEVLLRALPPSAASEPGAAPDLRDSWPRAPPAAPIA